MTSPADTHVLVIDDDPEVRYSLERVLTSRNYKIMLAGSGEEGIEVARKEQPEVILLDIGLPKLNGYEAARRIRSGPWGRDMFIIALTGWGQNSDKRRATDAGFDQHLTKPVDVTTLENLLNTLQPQSVL